MRRNDLEDGYLGRAAAQDAVEQYMGKGISVEVLLVRKTTWSSNSEAVEWLFAGADDWHTVRTWSHWTPLERLEQIISGNHTFSIHNLYWSAAATILSFNSPLNPIAHPSILTTQLNISLHQYLDSLDVLGVPGGSCDLAPAVHVDQDRRGWGHYDALPFCLGCLPWLVPYQLDLPLLHRGLRGLDCLGCWHDSNRSVLRFLFYLLHKVSYSHLVGVVGVWCMRCRHIWMKWMEGAKNGLDFVWMS